MKEEKIEDEGSIGIKARSVLWWLTFTGFAINYIIRINTSIAIVDMIDVNYKKTSSNKSTVVSECIVNVHKNFSNSSLEALDEEFNFKKPNSASLERRFLDFLGVEYERDGFKWDAHKQSQILGSFYWLHWLTQLPGGILASKYGTKYIFVAANGIACISCSLIPILCYLDYRLMVAMRLLQGFIAGFAWPSVNNLTGRWIPPNERSKFISSYLGSSLGVSLAYPLFGFIIKATSWEWVFHFCGIAGLIWSILWILFVFESPDKHPRIHPREKEYILKSLGSSVIQNSKEKPEIPWKSILTSKPVWLIVIAQWGGLWGHITIITQAPTYFRFIHGWGIEMTGILSGVPHFLRVGFAIVFGNFSDFLLSRGKMTRTNIRKLATFVSCILNGLAVLGLAYSDCNVTLAVFFLTISLLFHGAVSTGALASIVDISPNYASINLGIVSTIGIATGFISPLIVGYITFENQTVKAWQHIHEICGAMLIGCGLIYVLFFEATLQPWNSLEKKELKELEPLKKEEKQKEAN